MPSIDCPSTTETWKSMRHSYMIDSAAISSTRVGFEEIFAFCGYFQMCEEYEWTSLNTDSSSAMVLRFSYILDSLNFLDTIPDAMPEYEPKSLARAFSSNMKAMLLLLAKPPKNGTFSPLSLNIVVSLFLVVPLEVAVDQRVQVCREIHVHVLVIWGFARDHHCIVEAERMLWRVQWVASEENNVRAATVHLCSLHGSAAIWPPM